MYVYTDICVCAPGVLHYSTLHSIALSYVSMIIKSPRGADELLAELHLRPGCIYLPRLDQIYVQKVRMLYYEFGILQLTKHRPHSIINSCPILRRGTFVYYT